MEPISTPVSFFHCLRYFGWEFLKSEIRSIVCFGFFRLCFLMYAFAPLMARSSTVLPGCTIMAAMAVEATKTVMPIRISVARKILFISIPPPSVFGKAMTCLRIAEVEQKSVIPSCSRLQLCYSFHMMP